MEIPKELKILLIEDLERVNKYQQILPLPRNPTVRTILEEFTQQRQRKQQETQQNLTEGILEFFDVILAKALLYRLERPQYADLKFHSPSCSPSDYYGGEHLLRLLGKISY